MQTKCKPFFSRCPKRNAYLCIIKRDEMKKILSIFVLSLLCAACKETAKDDEPSRLQGAWLLRHVEYPMGTGDDYSTDGSGTFCLLYEGDSVLYECRLAATPTGLVVVPLAKTEVELIDKGRGEALYFEDGDPHPLQMDSSLTIQRNGIRYSYECADSQQLIKQRLFN